MDGKMYFCILLLTLVICTDVFQLTASADNLEWKVENYSNPWKEEARCGRERKSWICDPDRILTQRQGEVLDWILYDIKKHTRCPCSAYVCEKNLDGYNIAIALVRKIHRSSSNNSKEAVLEDVMNFASALENKHWNFGRCEEDVIIFYSVQDDILCTSFGRTVGRVLSKNVLSSITLNAGHHFSPDDDFVVGLLKMIVDIRKVMNNEYLPDPAEIPIGSSCHVTGEYTVALIMAVFAMVSSFQN